MLESTANEKNCLFCGDEKIPDGSVKSGIFHCSTCGKQEPTSYSFHWKEELISEFIPLFDVEGEAKTILHTTLRLILERMDADYCGFYALNPSYDFLQLLEYQGQDLKTRSITKIRIELSDTKHPLVICLQNKKKEFYRHIDYHHIYERFHKIFKRISKAKFSYLSPVYFKDKPLGVFALDFIEEAQFLQFKKKISVFNFLQKGFEISWNNQFVHNRYRTKYDQFQSLHSSGLTLNKLYLNNTQEIIRMTLLTMSGLTDTDLNLLIVYNHKFQALTIHKLWKDESNLELTQSNVPIEDIPEFQIVLDTKEPKLYLRKELPLAQRFGFNGLQALLLPGFELAGNKFSFVLGRNSRRLFSQDEVDILFAYSDLVRITIDNSLLYHGIAKQERLEKEVEIATDIQMNLLPREVPQHPDYEFSGFMIPAREIGGDYYDFLQSPGGEETLVAIGDVSGKGIPAGMVMATARTIIHSIIRKKISLDEILVELNSYLYHNYKYSVITRFMSMSLVRIQHDKKLIDFRGGGHGNILVYRSKSEEIESIYTGGMVLGIADEIPISTGEIYLEKGDCLLLFTDGATESQNSKGEMLEEQGLIKSLKKNAGKHPKEMLISIYEDIKSFSGSAPQYDDITLVCIRRK
jgi:phosphoserine phosphatase RsbU/P